MNCPEPSTSPLSHVPSGLSLQPIPGKGLGLLATRPFPRGSTLLREAPLLTQSLRRSAHTLARALSLLPADSQKAFRALHNAHPDLGDLGTFESNVLPCGGNDAHGHVASRGGVFVTAARLNASCAPNVNNHWDASSGLLVLRALRDIAEGEELCVAYGALLAPRVSRQKELKEKFGFECMCEVCVLSGKERKESDARRVAIAETYAAHMRGEFGDPMEGLCEAVACLRMLAEENLPVYNSSFLYSGFHCCAVVSDYASARLWARAARDASKVAFGSEHADGAWKALVAEPGAYVRAGERGKRTMVGPESALWAVLGLA